MNVFSFLFGINCQAILTKTGGRGGHARVLARVQACGCDNEKEMKERERDRERDREREKDGDGEREMKRAKEQVGMHNAYMYAYCTRNLSTIALKFSFSSIRPLSFR